MNYLVVILSDEPVMGTGNMHTVLQELNRFDTVNPIDKADLINWFSSNPTLGSVFSGVRPYKSEGLRFIVTCVTRDATLITKYNRAAMS